MWCVAITVQVALPIVADAVYIYRAVFVQRLLCIQAILCSVLRVNLGIGNGVVYILYIYMYIAGVSCRTSSH